MSSVTPNDKGRFDHFGEHKEAAQEQVVWEQRRMLECRCRFDQSCILVSNDLGWRHGMPREACDVCYSLGGEHNPEAKEFRGLHVAAVLGAMTHKACYSDNKPARDVLVQLTVKHKMIPEDRFNAPDIQNAIKAPISWVTVKSSWKKAASFLESLTSKLLDKTPPEAREFRQVSCFGETMDGKKVSAPCQMLREEGDNYFCGACGCGSNALAKLGTKAKKGVGEPSKLDYPKLECPLQKQGFSNERII